MANRQEILNYFETNKPVLFDKYRLKILALFGSYARQEQNENSDIDLLIEFIDGTENIHSKKLDLRREISERFNLDVDLCREKYLKDCFKSLIYKDAIYF